MQLGGLLNKEFETKRTSKNDSEVLKLGDSGDDCGSNQVGKLYEFNL